MCADKFPLFLNLVFSLVTCVRGDTNGLINTRELAEFLKVPIHRLILDHRKYLIVGEWEVFVFLKDFSGNAVQLYRNAIRGLDSRYLDMVFFNIILSEIISI